MDSGSSGGSMQSGGSSKEDDQNDTSSFSAGVASFPRLHNQHYLDHQLPLTTTHLHQQPSFSSQQHLHHYPSLTSMNTTKDHDNNNISGYNNPSPHLLSTNSFLETLPQSDLDRIWSSMSMNVNPNSHHHHLHQQQQQQLLHSSTSLLTPSSSTMTPNQTQTTNQDPQPRPIRKVSSLVPVKENGSSSCRVVKKRTRASRKTPTTVLTTDTTNFRAMVQEFTGIPTPPFSPSSLFPAKKFDIFGTNNGLDHQHPSLGSLLFSLNKSTNNNNNPNPSSLFAHPSITTASPVNPLAVERDQSGKPNPYQHHSQQMMLPQGSNSTILNQTQGSMIKNPNMSLFHHSSSKPQFPPFLSKYSGNEADQVGAFSNVERGENDNISRTS